MKKYLLIAVAFLLVGSSWGQSQKKDTLNGVIAADQVKVSKSGSKKEKNEAAIRAKAKELTRDLLEKSRLQFEPQYGRYHGYYKNLNNEKYTKKATNSAFNASGVVSGWHQDDTGGDFSGKPVIQIFNNHFYCNLDVILRQDTRVTSNRSARTSTSGELSTELKPGRTGDPKDDNTPTEFVTDYDSEEEIEMDKVVFNTEAFEITNIKNVNEYITTFDVIVKQPFSIENVYYDQFIFQCAMNILDARMAVRIIAGKDRICTTYQGDMNYIRGGSF